MDQTIREAKANTDKEIRVSGFLTDEQIADAANKRIELITKEFTQGFEFLRSYPQSVSVFGSSLSKEGDVYYEKARSLSHRIAKELKYTVTTGGGPGIMEAANRGAYEGHGRSVGISIKLPREQHTNHYVTDEISLNYFFARKVCLSYSAEAYVFFPGGFGTLDELFEILTLVQTRKIVAVPVILVGIEYWKPIVQFINNTLLTRGFIDQEDVDLFHVLDDENKILKIIKKAPVRNGVPYHDKPAEKPETPPELYTS